MEEKFALNYTYVDVHDGNGKPVLRLEETEVHRVAGYNGGCTERSKRRGR